MISTISALRGRLAAGLPVVALLAAATLAACSPGPSPDDVLDLGATPEAESSPAPTSTPSRLAVATPEVWPTPFGTPSSAVAGARRSTPGALGTATPTAGPARTTTPTAGTPTPIATATGTPMPAGTPTPTPTPEPSARMPELLGSLDAKVVDLGEALAEGDMDRALRLQRDLLVAADRVEGELRNDQSAEADLVRQAIADIRAGAGGDAGRLESARAKLRVAGGGTSRDPNTGSGTPGPASAATSRQVQSTAASLDNKLALLQQAMMEGGRDSLLRAQRELLDELGKAEEAAQDADPEEAQRLRDAISMAEQAAGGDMGKLGDARSRLETLLPAPSGAPAQAAQGSQSVRSSELPAIADELSRRVDSYRSAIQQGDRQEMLRQQKELLEQVNRTEQATRGNTGPQADQLHAALSDLRNALQGDLNKLNSANASLRLVANQPEALPTIAPLPQTSSEGQAAARDLLRALDGAELAMENGSPSDVARLERELEQAEQKILQLPPDEASALESAIDTVRDAMGGDHAKVEIARERLRELGPR